MAGERKKDENLDSISGEFRVEPYFTAKIDDM